MVEMVSCAWRERSGKREVAVAALVFWAIVTARLFWLSDAALIGALGTAYGAVTTSVFLFAAAAFGFDAWAKQGPGMASVHPWPKAE